ncbi:MAG: DNA polymerase II [Opitutae bacterium]|nr:DNA polymerase II [Opitutae bacterium]
MSTLIDTSRMSKGKRDALELTENARDKQPTRPSFASGLFLGQPDLTPISPFPAQHWDDKKAGDPFLKNLRCVLDEYVDADEIDRTGEIPDIVIDRLAEIGAFGIKIPIEYGGLGLSQTNYCRAAMLLGSRCGNLTALLSAHQSIGIPQPLLMFGNERQKKTFLPRVAKGEISAFALTEKEAGSDPARMQTSATPIKGGRYYLLNGEKLWCTNVTRAGLVVVMARTPPRKSRHGKRRPITAFIVDMKTSGIKVTHRCRFMGLRALYNGVVKFYNVKVPRENIILGEGKGLKVALSTLNTGRLTLPAACTGLAKQCLHETRLWVTNRNQWGSRIGDHEAISEKVAQMAADTFALESVVHLTSALVDEGDTDIRLEAAMAKMWGTETAWRIVDDAMQIRGGRGYETEASQSERSERPVPLERFMRDARINTIFEGSSEIMRLFLAREALDPHLCRAGAVLDSRLPFGKRLKAALKAGLFYAGWYPSKWLPFNFGIPKKVHESLRPNLVYIKDTSRLLARTLFHAMVRHGPALEKRQLQLSRIVEIGTELFVLTAATLHADLLIRRGHGEYRRKELVTLANYLLKRTKLKVRASFATLKDNLDPETREIGKAVLDEQLRELEDLPG